MLRVPLRCAGIAAHSPIAPGSDFGTYEHRRAPGTRRVTHQ
jgi:hypothetical protein